MGQTMCKKNSFVCENCGCRISQNVYIHQFKLCDECLEMKKCEELYEVARRECGE